MTAVFIDRGYFSKKNVPGFSSTLSMSAFPFWGEYSFLDFAFYNTCSISGRKGSRIAVCGKESKRNTALAKIKWEDTDLEYFSYDSDIESIIDFFNNIKTDKILIYDINIAGAIYQDQFLKLTEIAESSKSGEICKISINNVPVDIYTADISRLLDILKENMNFFSPGKNHFDIFLDDVLLRSFDRIIKLEGEIFFNNSIMQFYRNNISLIESGPDGKILSDFYSKVPCPLEKDSYISKKSKVVNSIISSNVKIDGYVENSIIFSDVTVKSNANIINSVIMNGNQIGRDVIITNALIFPNYKPSGTISNIQDKAVIGGNSKNAENSEYPDQVNSGLTFIGMNPSVPRGFIAEPGSIIGADISNVKLKQTGKVGKKSIIL